MDTSNILFICGGTFVGLDDIIGRRLGKRAIGFTQEGVGRDPLESGDLLQQVTSDDILQFGMIPELVGRCRSSRRSGRWTSTRWFAS